MKLRLAKWQGCGNDFLFLDGFREAVPEPDAELARRLCDRQFGLGADGLALLRPSSLDTADAEWVFFNCDGSPAEMCGNAARCAVRTLLESGHVRGPEVRLKTAAGVLRGRRLSDGRIEVSLFARADASLDEKMVALPDGQTFHTLSIDTGVPHAVIETKDLASYPVATVGAQLELHPAFGPRHTNVTFFQRVLGNEIFSTTFERGVSAETLACGTGVAAAALVFSQLYLRALPAVVTVPGGKLEVDADPETKLLLLRGNAEHLFDVAVDEQDVPARPDNFRRGNR